MSCLSSRRDEGAVAVVHVHVRLTGLMPHEDVTVDAERGDRLELGEEVRDVLVGLDIADLDVALLDELADVEATQVDVTCTRGQVRARRLRRSSGRRAA